MEIIFMFVDFENFIEPTTSCVLPTHAVSAVFYNPIGIPGAACYNNNMVTVWYILTVWFCVRYLHNIRSP